MHQSLRKFFPRFYRCGAVNHNRQLASTTTVGSLQDALLDRDNHGGKYQVQATKFDKASPSLRRGHGRQSRSNDASQFISTTIQHKFCIQICRSTRARLEAWRWPTRRHEGMETGGRQCQAKNVGLDRTGECEVSKCGCISCYRTSSCR